MKFPACASTLSRLCSSLPVHFSRRVPSSSHTPPVRIPPIFAGSRLPFPRFYCQAAIVDGAAAEEPAAAPVLWPEWEQLLGKLKLKGYFDGGSSLGEEDSAGIPPASDVGDRSMVKAACLGFARERFDILRSLAKDDIQIVVECGCPDLLRKTVNSAKRMRAFLRLDEGNVCSACNLRGSCDRAYVIPKDDEDSRTVDIMRILFSYAVNPDALSQLKPLDKENVEKSARKLLLNLSELCDTVLDPTLPRPAKANFSLKETSTNTVRSSPRTQNMVMKSGDWLCPRCNYLNFARNIRCLECEGRRRDEAHEVAQKPGDWICPGCKFMNFSRNRKCFQCQEPRKDEAHEAAHEVVQKPGDWICPGCKFMNFARNRNCFKCQERRQLKAGDWECPSCDFLNYARNDVCHKCNGAPPEGRRLAGVRP